MYLVLHQKHAVKLDDNDIVVAEKKLALQFTVLEKVELRTLSNTVAGFRALQSSFHETTIYNRSYLLWV